MYNLSGLLYSDKSNDNGSWQLKRPSYSYTANQGSLKRQADDDDDEFDFGETKKGNFRNDHQSPTHTTSQGRIPQQDQTSNKGKRVFKARLFKNDPVITSRLISRLST